MAELLEPEGGPEGEAGVGPISPSAAMAIGVRSGRTGAKHDPEFDAFLRKQSRLIEIQTEHLHEQRELVLSRLRWGRFGDRMKALLQVMTACVGLAVIVALACMAWTASKQRGLVVDPFAVPSELAQRGYDGQALASRFLDRLGQLDEESSSVRTPLGFHSAEQRELKLEIPETGISLGEVQHLLDRWLGHEVHVDGQVEASGDAITLAVHSGDQALIMVQGSARDIGALVDQAADQAFAQSQPYRYARYLMLTGRTQEGVARYQALALTGNAEDRAWATEAWGVAIANQGDLRAAVAKEYAGALQAPDFPLYWSNLVGLQQELGHDAAALRAAERGEAAAQSGRSSLLGPAARRFMEIVAKGNRAMMVGDFEHAAAEGAVEDALWPKVEHVPIWRTLVHEMQDQAEASAQAHDAAPAAAMVRNIADSQSVLAAQKPQNRAMIAEGLDVILAQMAAARGDWPTAWRQDATAVTLAKVGDPRSVMMLTARAAADAARAGHPAEAQALAANLPTDCYPCARARAEIANANHDLAGTDRAFAEAVRLAPSIPFAYIEWGQVKLANGDAAGAISQARQALQVGPHYADASELWGEALMRTGDLKQAPSEFAAAEKDAPHWGRNHLMWGQALMMLGRYAEARAQYQIADRLDLSVGDRAALNVLLARTAKGPLHG